MAAENVVKTSGRIEYIEPNNLFVRSEDNKVQNAIPQPYEDYSFSVNLRVYNGDRYSCGMASEGSDMVSDYLEFSSDNGTLSFMDGTSVNGQGYLTTNFTDISMNDPSTNTKECLGIESISIRYDSWYYPTVDIRFIDVRGASLMQPAEYEYYNNGNPSPVQGKNPASSNSDFFKAFFSFPYPLFKLSVKGFYGKEVTYDLSVLKCNVNFNSSTGNFEVNASFIGYMYGLYGDLPFPYIYLAPYIDIYGKNTWEEKKKTGDFCYISENKDIPAGTEMYTFTDLYSAVKNAGAAADKQLENSDDGILRSGLEKLISELQQKVLYCFPMSQNTSIGRSWWWWDKVDSETEKSGYYYLPIENTNDTRRKIFEDFLTFSTNLQNYNTSASTLKFCSDRKIQSNALFDDFYFDAERIRKNKSAQKQGQTVSSDYTDQEIKDILGKHIAFLSFHKEEKDKDKPVLVFDSAYSDFGKTDRNDFTDLIEELKSRFADDDASSPIQKNTAQKNWTLAAISFDKLDFKNGIISTINDMKKRVDELKTKLDEEREQTITKSIGLDPTIKNMYNMVFAHIDTFMSCFYNTLARIRQSIQSDDDTRKFEKLCGGQQGRIEVDVNDNTLKSDSSNGGKLPPFTMFYKEETIKDSEDKKMVMVWPGSLNGGENLDEVKFVEAIINATSLSKRSFDSVTPKHNVIEYEGELVPINYYDIIRDGGNPYLDIINEKTLQNEETVREVVKVFLLRCFYSMANGSYITPESGENSDGNASSTTNYTNKAKLIAEIEAKNIGRTFQLLNMKPTESFLRGLLKLSNDGKTTLSGFLNGDKPIFKTNGINGDIVYNWIPKYKVNETGKTFLYNCLPVGTFISSSLAKYNGGDNLKEDAGKFLKISQTGTIVNGPYSCRIYPGGKKIEKTFSKYTSGDFSKAMRLFPSYGKLPKTISELKFADKTFCKRLNNITKTSIGILEKTGMKIEPVYEDVSVGSLYKNGFSGNILLPSYRNTSAGITNIFMDPLYYAQKSIEARAYLFLMGVPFGKNKGYFIPEKSENGDYPTLLLLREGAYYWRNEWIKTITEDGGPKPIFEDDPIVYEYTINGNRINALDDIEKNDACFGRTMALEFYKEPPKNVSQGRKRTLIDYFLKWAGGVDAEKNPYAVTAESYTHVEVPSTLMSFQTIEQNLALWESNGTTKQILSPNSCASAVTQETVSAFENATALRIFYGVGQDNRLGTLLKNTIRKDVFLKEIDGNQTVSDVYKKFYDDFTKFYVGFDTFIDFSCLDEPKSIVSVPRNALTDALSSFAKNLKDQNEVSLKKLNENKGVSTSGKPEDKEKKHEYYKNDDLKLACYIALKNMYDRWLCNRRRECWNFSCIPERMNTKPIKSDFLRFFYIDEFYHNIGMKVRTNLTNFVEAACDLGGERASDSNAESSSIIKFLSTVAQDARCSLLTLPTMLGLGNTYTSEKNSIADVFKAFTYNEAVRSDSIETSFVILSTSQKSTNLNVPDDKGKMGYKSDGFDIANTWGEIVEQPFFSDAASDGYPVPSFGVTFAKQNQSFFKDINLSMEDHELTEFAIRNQVMISYESNRGPRETNIVGQDLYSVYSNYSYSCTVSMMGDAQITPLMYFQLNNIPMWKGAYLITNVHHDITPQGMETTFTGVRQARPSLPYKDDKMLITANSATKQTPQSQEKTHIAPENRDGDTVLHGKLDEIDMTNVRGIIFILDRTSLRTSEKWVNGLLSVRVLFEDGSVKNYMDIAQTIEAVYGLEEQINKMGTKDGRIENFTPPQDNNVLFCLPSGRFSSVFNENPFEGEEYRDKNDGFYKFTDGKHIIVSDMRLGSKRCEIITGETSYDKFESGGFSEISIGGIAPIMIYPPAEPDMNKQLDRNEIRATYKEIFNLVKRAREGKKLVTLLINEPSDIREKKS